MGRIYENINKLIGTVKRTDKIDNFSPIRQQDAGVRRFYIDIPNFRFSPVRVFIIMLLLITSILSYLYLKDAIRSNKEKILSYSKNIAKGVQNNFAGIIGIFGNITQIQEMGFL
jgi:hypothetical protein